MELRAPDPFVWQNAIFDWGVFSVLLRLAHLGYCILLIFCKFFDETAPTQNFYKYNYSSKPHTTVILGSTNTSAIPIEKKRRTTHKAPSRGTHTQRATRTRS